MRDKNTKENNDKYIKQGNLLYELRDKRKMTQNKLAELLETDYRNISKYELGSTFPDKQKQDKLCEIFNITLEELHQGEINSLKRKKDKIMKILSYLFCFMTPIFIIGIIALCLTLINFKKNYDPSEIYYLSIENDLMAYCRIDGIYMKSKKEKFLHIGAIKILDYNIKDTDSINVVFYFNDEIIYSKNALDNILFKVDSSIPINEIRFAITITSAKNKITYENEYKITSTDLDSTTIPTARIFEIENNQIINELLKMGFKKNNEGDYIYIENNKDSIINIRYDDELNKLQYEENTKTLLTTIEYYLITDDIRAKIASLGNNSMIIEDYEYNLKTKQLVNNIGNGYTLENSLKTMDKYISRLKSE